MPPVFFALMDHEQLLPGALLFAWSLAVVIVIALVRRSSGVSQFRTSIKHVIEVPPRRSANQKKPPDLWRYGIEVVSGNEAVRQERQFQELWRWRQRHLHRPGRRTTSSKAERRILRKHPSRLTGQAPAEVPDVVFEPELPPKLQA